MGLIMIIRRPITYPTLLSDLTKELRRHDDRDIEKDDTGSEGCHLLGRPSRSVSVPCVSVTHSSKGS